MIAGNADRPGLTQQIDSFIHQWVITDQIAGADNLIDALCAHLGQRSRKPKNVCVNVRYDPNLQVGSFTKDADKDSNE